MHTYSESKPLGSEDFNRSYDSKKHTMTLLRNARPPQPKADVVAEPTKISSNIKLQNAIEEFIRVEIRRGVYAGSNNTFKAGQIQSMLQHFAQPIFAFNIGTGGKGGKKASSTSTHHDCGACTEVFDPL